MTSFNVSFKFLIFYQALGESFQRKELYLQTSKRRKSIRDSFSSRSSEVCLCY